MASAHGTTDHRSGASFASIDDYLDLGTPAGSGSHRSRSEARKLLPAFDKAIGGPAIPAEWNPLVEEFLSETVLAAVWYRRKYAGAKRSVFWMWFVNGAMVLLIPCALILLGKIEAARGAVIGSQVAGLLTGILALQKSFSSWYGQQVRYAAWYKACADLKTIYYGLEQKWYEAAVADRETEFLADLYDAIGRARQVIDAEQLDFYQHLALPSFDVLDMLTSTKSTVASLISSASAPPRQAMAIGKNAVLSLPVTPGEEAAAVSTEAARPRALAQAKPPSPLPASLDSASVTACAGIALSNAADVSGLFQKAGGFAAWYAAHLANLPPFAARRRLTVNTTHFTNFWDRIPLTFGKPQITAIEFAALMCINIKENSGDLAGHPEQINGPKGPYPGLAYLFDRIPNKQSYNLLSGNKTALALFNDALFVKVHGGLGGASDILHREGGIDPTWGGSSWPAGWPTSSTDPKNAFVEQADFFKFRGRGVIQTTGRSAYRSLLDYIVKSDSNAAFKQLTAKWRGLAGTVDLDDLATVSSNADWDVAFAEAELLAVGVAMHNRENGNYLDLGHDNATLNGGKDAAGSLWHMASRINASNYSALVVPMMQAMILAIAADVTPAPTALRASPAV